MSGNQSKAGPYMDRTHLERCVEIDEPPSRAFPSSSYVSMETEVPEVLYRGMKAFIESHPKLDQYSLVSSALANFLFQNGCHDRAVTEKYLNDLFSKEEN